ncbi:hypothetical protein CTM97_08885 [Photobacterium phosphoreum]|uniref:Uncharacterized protein n=1 Tax=Photobacterium phosphoreum TaxID=659 RepID=A0A2T3JQ48_PHOPO|nr:hypothetical protein CTM96_11970 [Photobacterium phosphoreum]PSU42315.1 hypothetical protein CTM97_08885 [Photobacterium phosphoreum]PSU51173.1 hypothetical protein C9J18_13360 [Photobacterium phosphoreum]
MRNYLVFSLLFISTSVLANNTDVLNSKFHNPDNKKLTHKASPQRIDNKGIINPKFHHPDNKEHHVIRKSKKTPSSTPAL